METVKKYLTHPKLFFFALIGKPMPVEIPEGQVTYQTNPNTPAPVTKPVSPDDPLHQDLEKAASLLKTITAKLPKVALPVPTQASQPEDPALRHVSEIIKPNKFKKFLPIIIFGVIILVILIAGVTIVLPIISKMRAPKDNPIIVTNPSPTPIEQAPIQPSIYANDSDVLKLQEDINVLDREVVGTQLRESTLNTPVLDFNISF